MQAQTLNPNDTLDGSNSAANGPTAAELEAQLQEARAERDDLQADLPTLETRAAEFGRGADEARRGHDLNRAVDLQHQQQVFENLARGQRGDIDALAGEIEKLEQRIKTAQRRSQLVTLAKEATAALEQVNRRAEGMSAHLLTELRCLSTDVDALEQKQYGFDRTLRELGMNRAAFSVKRTPEQEDEVVSYLLELEQREGVDLDAVLMKRYGQIQPGSRAHVTVADAPPLGTALFRLMHEMREHPGNFEEAQR